MYKINIVCVGKLKEKHFLSAQEEYLKRLSRFCEIKVTEKNLGDRKMRVEPGYQ